MIEAKLGARHPGMRAAGLTDTAYKQYTDGRREVTRLTILMRHTTPQAEFERTAAHELTHAWMSLAGAPQAKYVIEASTNFSNWQSISTNTLPVNGLMQIGDPLGSGFAQRYYRAVKVP